MQQQILTKRKPAFQSRAALVIPAVCMALVLSCGSDNHRHDASSQEIGCPPTFFAMLSDGFHQEYQTVPVATELLAYSDVVVVGRAVELQEGGQVGGARSSVVQTIVQEVLKGSPGEVVHIELRHGYSSATEALQGSLPQQPGLWFLQDAEDVLAPNALDEGRGERGIPPGERLLAPASPQGLVIECEGALLQPLDPEEDRWWRELAQYNSLQEFIAALAAE